MGMIIEWFALTVIICGLLSLAVVGLYNMYTSYIVDKEILTRHQARIAAKRAGMKRA